MSPAPPERYKLSEARKGGMNTAFLVVDMQNDFIHFKNSPVYVPLAANIIPRITKLLAICKKKRIPVIYAFTAHNKNKSGWALLDKMYNRAYCIENTPGARIIPEIEPQGKEYVIKKRRYSAFYKTGLERLLKRLKVKRLIVCGVTTSCCISSTIRDAYFRDYQILVVSDAVSASHKDLHRAALKYFRENIGRVLKTGEVIKLLKSRKEEE